MVSGDRAFSSEKDAISEALYIVQSGSAVFIDKAL
jgi:hypothetical protein